MLANLEMREANIWIQTDAPAKIRVRYRDSEKREHWSLPVVTDSTLANTATLKLRKIEPGLQYSYTIELNGKLTQKGGQFQAPDFYHERTPPPDLRIAVGGAHYAVQENYEPPYQILGGGYSIFETILENEPQYMIWTGDTAHLRESDWTSQSGYLKRFSTARAVPELQPLLANIPNIATWAQYDYATKNVGKYYAHREFAETAFRAFWPMPANMPGLSGIMTRFRSSDVDFIILDVRSHRNNSVKSDRFPEILGDEQIEWLRQELIASTATFKVIVAGAPILNPAENPANLSAANYEQNKLLEMLRSERIPGLFFISGGKRNGELTRLVHANSYNIYDLTVGPLTAIPEESDELNFFRMPGTNTLERQFALIDFEGPENDRQIRIRVMNIEGKEIWSRVIKANQLTRK
jgi:alkaline phosphatase D